jgi:transposase
MSENESMAASRTRRAKRLLSPSQKYEIWLQLMRQELTVVEVAAAQQWYASPGRTGWPV